MARLRKSKTTSNASATEPTVGSEHSEAVEEPIEITGLDPVAAQDKPAGEAPAKEKLQIPLDSDGGFDLGSMRERTRAKLVTALRKSNKELFPEDAKPPIVRMPDGIVVWAYRILGTLEATMASTRMPAEIAERVFPFSDEEIGALMEPTQKVLSKHVGSLKWQEEIELAIVLGGIHFRKMAELRTLLAEHADKMKAAA